MKKFFLMLFGIICIFSSLFSQNHTITGKVTDDKGEPIATASVLVKGTRAGTTSNNDGIFTLTIAANVKTLIISYINMETQEVEVTGSYINVTMHPGNSKNLEAVVITALGIARESRSLGYALSRVNNNTLTQGKSVNLQQALNGKVSGLNISTVNSGVFENAKINVRGIRSLTGNNQPMLVVDGAPTPLGYLSSIPPDDVQDLTILKSAASAAIYGPDAVNGVIIVTN